MRILLLLLLLSAPLLAPAALSADVPTTGNVATAAGPVPVALRIDGRARAKLDLLRIDGTVRRSIPLTTPEDAAALLVDRRIAFLWPALTAWAGDDLVRLRDRMLADSEAAFARGSLAGEPTLSERAVGKRAGAIMNRARLLAIGGRRKEGIALLRESTDAWAVQHRWNRGEQVVMLVSLAGLLMSAGDLDEADAVLARYEPAVASDRSDSLNLLINRASLLTLRGRHAEALAMADRASDGYASYQNTIGGRVSTIPGSERYFAMVRACALDGLGRSDEASAALQPLLAAREPGSLLWPVDPTIGIRARAASCGQDSGGLARTLAEAIAAFPLPTELLAYLVPGSGVTPPREALFAAARADPAFQAASRDTLRPLPAAMAIDWNR